MSLRTDDIEGARPKYFEKQKLIARAQQINNGSNIFSPPNLQQQSIPMRNPDQYASQVLNQNYSQNPSMQQIDRQIENPSQVQQGRERSIYQMEYQGESPNILQNRGSVQQMEYARPNRNPIVHMSSNKNQGKMQSEKQYQEQLVMNEIQKFKEQQIIIDQVKKRRELEYREQEMLRKQKEQEQLRQIQSQQEEKLRLQRKQEEDRQIIEMAERDNHLKAQEEIRYREQLLKEKERYLQEQEQLAQQQRKSAQLNRQPISNNNNNNQQDKQFVPEQYAEDTALYNQINSQSQSIPLNHGRVPSSNQNNHIQGLNSVASQPDLNYPEVNRRTPLPQLDQGILNNNSIVSSSPPGNAKYFNTPMPSAYKQIDQSQLQDRNNQVKTNQLAGKSILSPISAILQHNGDQAGRNASVNRQKQKQTRVLAIIDSDSKVREYVNKFFGIRGINEYQLFCLPGSGAGLINDKGWRDTFFSCFSFMRQMYDFTDIFIFSFIESSMIPLWSEQSNVQDSIAYNSSLLKNYHVDTLKQSVAIVQQNISETIKVSAFFFDNRGGTEKIC